MISSQLQKEEGNKLFSDGKWAEAVQCYTKAIELSPTPNGSLVDLAVYYKNRAACYLKLERYTAAAKDATNALELVGNDTKSLFRRCQALLALGKLEEAFTDARMVLHIEPQNTAIQPVLRKITAAIQDKAKKQSSTKSKVDQMFDLAFNKECGKEKRLQACNNLIVLAREDAGAELIFKANGVMKLSRLINEKDTEIVMSAIRTLSCLCHHNKARARLVIREINPAKWFHLICLPSEQLTNAVAHMLQNIIDSISELYLLHEKRKKHEEKKRKEGPQMLGPYPQLQLDEESQQDIDSLLMAIVKLINSGKISACGRDAAIELIMKNVTNQEGVDWSKKILETDGISRLLEVGGTLQSSDAGALKITESTRMNVAVALSKIYDDLISEKSCDKFKDQCQQHMSEQFGDSDQSSQVEAIVAVSTLLQGPYVVGNSILGRQGVMEIMLAMAGSEDPLYQKVAVEALVHSANKKEKCSGMIKQAVPILKQLYHSKNENVKVRALVGLCKLGSFGGTDVSAKSFAEGSTLKLAKSCRKFLTNKATDFDLRRWACEGLAYLTLDADVKEELVDDTEAILSLIDLAKDGDKSVIYPAATVFVNMTNSYDKKEVDKEMVELAKFAKQHVPEEHEKDKKEYLDKRVSKLVKAGLVNALVCLSKTQSEMCKELICRVFFAICKNEEHRGLVVQQGGAKCLIPLSIDGNEIGNTLAAQALAKIGITMDPQVAFPGQRTLEVVRPLLQLLRIEMPAIMNFEALMALTNLASVSDSIRKRILKEKGFSQIEHYMFEEHGMLKRAATECMCNLVLCEDSLPYFHGDNDRVKILVLYCGGEEEDGNDNDDDNDDNDDDDDDDDKDDVNKMVIAAAGALAVISDDKQVCEKILQVKSWEEILCLITLSENLDIKHRACHIIMNIMASGKELALKLIESKLLEVLMALSLKREPEYAKIKECADSALKHAHDLELIKLNPEV